MLILPLKWEQRSDAQKDTAKRKRKRKSEFARNAKKTVDVKGANFCCFCGSDIRSNKEKLIKRIEDAFVDISFMPQNRRDDMQKLFIDIINEFKG